MKNLTFALRYLSKSTNSNITRIVSITLGLVLGLLSFSYVTFDLSFDSFFPNKERIYQLWVQYNMEGLNDKGTSCYAPVAPALAEEMPQIEQATRLKRFPQMRFFRDEKSFESQALVADTTLFDVLDFGVITGDPHSALAGKEQMMISERLARQIFGTGDPVGEVLQLNNNRPFTVSGIFRNVPANCHLGQFDAILPFGLVDEMGFYTGWNGGDSFSVYVKLKKGSRIESVQSQIRDFFNRHSKATANLIDKGEMSFFFVPLTSTALVSGDVAHMALILSILAIIVLFVASMNYVLISVSMLVRRGKTIGTLKCNGAGKRDIFAIFLYETAAILVTSGVLSALLIYGLRSQIGGLTGVPVGALFAWERLWAPLLVIVAMFLMSGLIPASIFSSVSVRAAFKNASDNKRRWKQALLFVQFTSVTLVFTFVLISGLQFRKIVSADLGYEHDRAVIVLINGSGREIRLVQQTLAAMPQVERIGMSEGMPLSGYSGESCFDEQTREELFSCRTEAIDPGYLPAMGMQIVAGRNFTENSGPDELLVNETYVRLRGWKENPVGKSVRSESRTCTIVGVVRDFQTGVINTELSPFVIHPVALRDSVEMGMLLTVRLGELTPEAVKAVESQLKALDLKAQCDLWIFDNIMALELKEQHTFRNTVGTISVVTLLITLMGLVGYLSDEIRRRNREIAIRKVNGATARDITRLVLHDTMAVTLPAVLLGLVGAYLFGQKWLQQFNEKIPLSWWIFLCAAAFVIATVTAVALLTTRRAANENPAKTIKTE